VLTADDLEYDIPEPFGRATHVICKRVR